MPEEVREISIIGGKT